MAIASETSAMGRDDRFVSPYLLRPLRSYLQALRERARRQRRDNAPALQKPESDVAADESDSRHRSGKSDPKR